MDFQTSAIYGPADNTSALPAGSWDPSGSEANIGQIIQAGILGTAQAAINAAVADKYASGQLIPVQTQTVMVAQQTPNQKLVTWLLIGGAVYLLAKG